MTYHCSVYSEKTPDSGQSNCTKHVEFNSKNKFEKLVHLVGIIIRIWGMFVQTVGRDDFLAFRKRAEVYERPETLQTSFSVVTLQNPTILVV